MFSYVVEEQRDVRSAFSLWLNCGGYVGRCWPVWVFRDWANRRKSLDCGQQWPSWHLSCPCGKELRIRCRKAWGFKSPLSQKILSRSVLAILNL